MALGDHRYQGRRAGHLGRALVQRWVALGRSIVVQLRLAVRPQGRIPGHRPESLQIGISRRDEYPEDGFLAWGYAAHS